MKPQDERNHVQGLMSKAALEKQLRQLKKVSDQPAIKDKEPAPGAWGVGGCGLQVEGVARVCVVGYQF